MTDHEDFWKFLHLQLVHSEKWKDQDLSHMEDIKIIKQEVHAEEDIKNHTLVLIWKQSVWRMCRNWANLATLPGVERWGHISQLIKFLWASDSLLLLPHQIATEIPSVPTSLWLCINILKITRPYLTHITKFPLPRSQAFTQHNLEPLSPTIVVYVHLHRRNYKLPCLSMQGIYQNTFLVSTSVTAAEWTQHM